MSRTPNTGACGHGGAASQRVKTRIDNFVAPGAVGAKLEMTVDRLLSAGFVNLPCLRLGAFLGVEAGASGRGLSAGVVAISSDGSSPPWLGRRRCAARRTTR